MHQFIGSTVPGSPYRDLWKRGLGLEYLLGYDRVLLFSHFLTSDSSYLSGDMRTLLALCIERCEWD